jgi:hypothetical protein
MGDRPRDRTSYAPLAAGEIESAGAAWGQRQPRARTPPAGPRSGLLERELLPIESACRGQQQQQEAAGVHTRPVGSVHRDSVVSRVEHEAALADSERHKTENARLPQALSSIPLAAGDDEQKLLQLELWSVRTKIAALETLRNGHAVRPAPGGERRLRSPGSSRMFWFTTDGSQVTVAGKAIDAWKQLELWSVHHAEGSPRTLAV